MQHSIPDSDAEALKHHLALYPASQHRAEAKSYLPKTDAEYRADIEAGTDPYTSKWFVYALVGLGIYICGHIMFELLAWAPPTS